ncbi:MAG TPA: hypothetical protein VGR15_08355, partial [Bacteroidota bacterium]|nr:hypothetical protein [Bacteroidota bacterium]
MRPLLAKEGATGEVDAGRRCTLRHYLGLNLRETMIILWHQVHGIPFGERAMMTCKTYPPSTLMQRHIKYFFLFE